MKDIFMILMLVSIVGLVIGLIKPSVVKMKSRKVSLLVFGGGFIVFFILVGVTAAPSTSENNNSVAQNVVTQTAVLQSLDSQIQNAISNIDGLTTKVSYRDKQVEKSDKDRPQDTKMVTINVNINSFYNKDALIRDTGKISSEIFKAVYVSNLNPYDVFVWYYSDTTDQYGNKTNDVVLTYAIDKITFQKINWSNFDEAGFCDFLKQEGSTGNSSINAACNTLIDIK